MHDKEKTMGGSLTEQELVDIKNKGPPYSQIKHFVETGTYKGDSTLMAAKQFENVYTIEIYQPLYLESKERAEHENIKNIEFYLGDSLECLPNICDKIKKNGAVFFIDAHISGSDSGWNNKIRVPLLEEIDIILSRPIGPSVFIVDDLRLWKTIKAFDWVHITNELLIEKIQKKGIEVFDHYEKDDRFYIYTR